MAQYFCEFCDLTSNHENFPHEIKYFDGCGYMLCNTAHVSTRAI